MYTPAQISESVAQGMTFCDANLDPVTPQCGEWYCEFDGWGRDQALVRYEGAGQVAPEYADGCREPRGILVRQA